MKRALPFYQSVEWKAARALALARAGYRCEWCGESVRGLFRGRVDHIVPLRENSALALAQTNLRVLCNDCDAKRHADKGRKNPAVSVGLDGYPEK